MSLTLTTVVMHNFWDYAHDNALRQSQAIQFLKVNDKAIIHTFSYVSLFCTLLQDSG
jgi:hypothetical protein